jgi:hypothetical protein
MYLNYQQNNFAFTFEFVNAHLILSIWQIVCLNLGSRFHCDSLKDTKLQWQSSNWYNIYILGVNTSEPKN